METELLELVLEEQIDLLKKQNDFLNEKLDRYKKQTADLLERKNELEYSVKKLKSAIKIQKKHFFSIANKWRINQGFLAIVMDQETISTEKQIEATNIRMDINNKEALVIFEKIFSKNKKLEDLKNQISNVNTSEVLENNFKYFKSFFLLKNIDLNYKQTSKPIIKHHFGYFDKLIKNILFILIKQAENSSCIDLSALVEGHVYLLKFKYSQNKSFEHQNNFNLASEFENNKTTNIEFKDFEWKGSLMQLEKISKNWKETPSQTVSILIEQLR